MVNTIQALGYSLVNIRKAIDVHNNNVVNMNTEGYIARSGGFTPVGLGAITFNERLPSARAYQDAANLFSSKTDKESDERIANLHSNSLVPLSQDSYNELREAIAAMNYNYDLKTEGDKAVDKQRVIGNINVMIDNYVENLKNWGKVSNEENIGVPTNDGTGIMQQGFKNLMVSFEDFKEQINNAFGGNVITGDIKNAVVDKSLINGPVTSLVDDVIAEYNTILAVKQLELNGNVQTSTEIYNAKLNSFEAEYGVKLEEEVTKILSLQNQYDAVAKVIRVKDEMFQTLLDIKT